MYAGDCLCHSSKVRPPKTELGKRIRQQSGAASVLVDGSVEEIGRPVLKGAEYETIQPGNAATASIALLRLSDRNLVAAEPRC